MTDNPKQMSPTTSADSPDTPEQKAFRRGKAAGYSVGIVDGWDACMRHVSGAFDKAIAAATTEPETVSKHRQAVLEAQRGQETDNAKPEA